VNVVARRILDYAEVFIYLILMQSYYVEGGKRESPGNISQPMIHKGHFW